MTPLTDKDIIRRCLFRPYANGHGPLFTLVGWDCHTTRLNGPQWQLGYRLAMKENGKEPVVLFQGEDYGYSPLHATDSDACIAGIMNFLTLRPGDTDREYFDEYTQEQLDYCCHHAEALSCEVMTQFGEV